MPSVFVLPGVFGSELLVRRITGQVNVWASYFSLGTGSARFMKLAPDGVSPDPQWGSNLFPGLPLSDYYGTCISTLQKQLGPLGWNVQGVGYDFRMDIRQTAKRFAFLIQASVSPLDPCTIVAHSMGGLVARATWAYLAQAGATNLVRRIITLGTPHYGSYDMWDFLHGREELIQFLASITRFSWFALGVIPRPDADLAMGFLMSILYSCPGLYQLLPFANDGLLPPDPWRSAVFDPSNYPHQWQINQTWLSDAKASWLTFITDPGTQPPPNVLFCIVGVSSGNVYSALRQDASVVPPAYNAAYSVDGDARVAAVKASLPTAGYVVKVQVGHQDLPKVCAVNGLLSTLIRADTPPPSLPFIFGGPPFFLDVSPGGNNPHKLGVPINTDPRYMATIPWEELPQPVVALPELGPPPFPTRNRIAATGVPQVIDHDC